jgi:hypothetical protein
MLRRIGVWAIGAIVLIAIWRMNNGDVNTLIDNIWNILSQGADVAIKIWHSVVGISGHIADTSSVAPAPVATPAA